MEYREYGPEVEGDRPLERTVYYTYQNTGHVSHITVKDEGYDTVKDLYLAYGTDEKVGAVRGETGTRLVFGARNRDAEVRDRQ